MKIDLELCLGVIGLFTGTLIVVCQFCGRFLRTRSAKSSSKAHGGVSHGACYPPCDQAKDMGYTGETTS